MLKRLWKSLKKRTRKKERLFTGPYATWAEAKSRSTGWDADVILEKTRIALGKVRDGEAVYERDSVVFDKIHYSYALLAGLLRAASEFDNEVTVLDFGGAIGTSYYQCRPFLAALSRLQWWVVDQPKQVDCGKKEFANDELHFAHSVEEVVQQAQPNVLLLSSVIHYLETPYAILEKLLALKIPYFIVDRTPFLEKRTDDLIMVQHVPSSIYKASFPLWQLSSPNFLGRVAENYSILAEFEAQPRDTMRLGDIVASHRGLIAHYKQGAPRNNNRAA